MIPSMKEMDLKGKRVLMRVDFNVPTRSEGVIADDTRIRLTLPSIRYVLEKGGIPILMSHLGRPKGEATSRFSLQSCAKCLEKRIGKRVQFAPDCVGETVEKQAQRLKQGELLLLENLRFHKAEEEPALDPHFAKQLAALGDCFVNDAFGAAHRAHSSIVPITTLFPKRCGIGLLMEREIERLSSLFTTPKHPFYALIGGAKVGNKLGILNKLAEKADALFIGGGMAFTFLKAKGREIGASLCEEGMIEEARALMERCIKRKKRIYLPADIVATNGEEIRELSKEQDIPPGFKGMDVGKATIQEWKMALSNGATLFWNGPVGVFEEPAFAGGTHALAELLASLPGEVIVGGGDSLSAITQLKLEKHFYHLSSGGGASLEFIEKGHLVGIDAIVLSNNAPML